jgi:hypothetical protein
MKHTLVTLFFLSDMTLILFVAKSVVHIVMSFSQPEIKTHTLTSYFETIHKSKWNFTAAFTFFQTKTIV